MTARIVAVIGASLVAAVLAWRGHVLTPTVIAVFVLLAVSE